MVTGYRTMRFTDGARWWLYTGDSALGTSLCFRHEWWREHPFRRLHIGEDVLFIHEAAAKQQTAVVECGEMMYAAIHPGNTSAKGLSGPSWKELK
jgi:hypothetical protein